MPKKLIIGIEHNGSEKELSNLKVIIDEHKPQKLGLELPENYKELREAYGARYPPFSELSTYSKSKGIIVIPLEYPDLRVRANQIETAKAVLEGGISREDLERDLVELAYVISNSYSDVEIFPAMRVEENCRGALAILEEMQGNLDKFMSFYAEFQGERERYFLEGISRTQPNLVIMGFHHVEKLIDYLIDYSYLQLHPSENPVLK